MGKGVFDYSKVMYDEDSFIKQIGESRVSESLKSAIIQFAEQMDEKNGIDDVTFNHADYGENVTVYLRRGQGGYLVSLEGKDFTPED